LICAALIFATAIANQAARTVGPDSIMTTWMLFTKINFAFFVDEAVFRLRPFFSCPKKPKKGQATRETAT
jgi:hypothetical protein